MINWISEGEKLPRVGQTVLLATPRQHGEFWDVEIAMILLRHEGVFPRPVKAGSDWPVDFYWGRSSGPQHTRLVTGNGWWASLADIPLPPGAEHGSERGYDFIRQIGQAFIPKAA